MPIKLDKRSIDRTAALPMHQQLADHIRQAITSHDLQPGEALPSEPLIADRVGMSRNTVRQATNALVAEGILTRRTGSGTFVAKLPPARRLDSARYVEQMRDLKAGKRPGSAAIVLEHGAGWEDFTVECDFSKGSATPGDVEHLQVPLGSPILRRRMVKLIRDEPVQIHRSAMPWDLAKGTGMGDPSRQPYKGGTLAELFDAGIIPTSFIEEVEGRAPNAQERSLLQVEVGTVFVVTRTFLRDEQPVEVSRMIAPQAKNKLRYEAVLS